MQILEFLCVPAFIAVWAVVFSRLQDPEEIFSFIPVLVHKMIQSTKSRYDMRTDTWIEKAAYKWLGGCAKCHAGFVAVFAVPAFIDYDYLLHFMGVVLSIFFTLIFQKITL